MKNFSFSKDIVPVGKFKINVSKWLNSINNSGHPLIITQNGKPAGVLLSPSEYDDLIYQKEFLESVAKGVSGADSDNLFSTAELKTRISGRKNQA